MPRGLEFWSLLNEAFEVAAATASKRVQHLFHSRRKGSFITRRPGFETPLWNVCATLLERELKPRGSKVRLARYLGIPKQRLQDFLKGRSRLPDAELTLRMLHWVAAKRSGKDHAI